MPLSDTERQKQRSRRVALTAASSMAAKVVQMSLSLLTVPLTLRYLGTERFGLWMTINAVLAMASFADFGIGNGLLNVVSEAFGNDDVEGVRRAVSSGFAIMIAIAGCLLAIFFSVYPFIDWGHFFGATAPQARAEAAPALAVFALCFALNIAIDVVQRVQLALQQGYRYAVWQGFGSLLAFCGLLVSIYFRVGLPILVISLAGAPVLATALNALHFFTIVRPDLRPVRSHVSLALVRRIGKLGVMFFALQLVSAISFSGDNFILARTLGAGSVPQYSVPQRLFAVIAMSVMMLVGPLWPAYGEALARFDVGWISRTLRKSLLLVGIGGAVGAALLLFFAPRLLRLWVGPSIHPPFAMLLGLAIWSFIGNVGYTMEMFLNAMGKIRVQVVIAGIFGCGCVALKVYSVRRFGATALPWATITSYLLLSALPIGLYGPVLLRRVRANAATAKASIPVNS